jgi:hypothetical protein
MIAPQREAFVAHSRTADAFELRLRIDRADLAREQDRG